MTLNVLIACEESGAVRDAFRALGHNAWSCDLQPCSPSPFSAYHVQGDAVALLNRDAANMYCAANGWDLLIGHPPCTYLCNSGVTWLFRDQTYGYKLWSNTPRKPSHYRFANEARATAMFDGVSFFNKLYRSDIPHIAIENPIMHGYARYAGNIPKPDQIIQPWMFGHAESKATCLWLRNLPKLQTTYNVKDIMDALPKQMRQRLHYLSPSKDRAKLRSKTFSGIALAMATQWSEYIINEQTNRIHTNAYADGAPPTGGVQVHLPRARQSRLPRARVCQSNP